MEEREQKVIMVNPAWLFLREVILMTDSSLGVVTSQICIF